MAESRVIGRARYFRFASRANPFRPPLLTPRMPLKNTAAVPAFGLFQLSVSPFQSSRFTPAVYVERLPYPGRRGQTCDAYHVSGATRFPPASVFVCPSPNVRSLRQEFSCRVQEFHMRRVICLAVLLCGFWMPSADLSAWGDHGHEIVARLAARKLTPNTKRALVTIL